MRKSDFVYILGFISFFYLGWHTHQGTKDPMCQFVTERYQYLIQHGEDSEIYVSTGSLD